MLSQFTVVGWRVGSIPTWRLSLMVPSGVADQYLECDILWCRSPHKLRLIATSISHAIRVAARGIDQFVLWPNKVVVCRQTTIL